ncbi:hypothetical protein SAMN05216488_0767 [Microbacterium sp. LKL04]|uniref:4-hydroxybenzoate polyprenyltransferase n=1 Tax=Microbacterium oleivorans TaxID=273677 RepID=A0A4V3B349_9MICO|nr:hypothetical protein [Microbacterium]MDQ1127164.1 large-conductance mechanosensitive channel [Microbacterium sp. SORGH_AS_0505]TDL43340.1 hypothetical protein E2R54_08875 [Microbacterium oleivorans]SCY14773.1 hypothetical protein SAMN05216488_0767 [Microbacterium sp. LKL04]
MNFATTIVRAAAETEHHGGNVMATTFGYGIVAFVLFLLLGLVTLSYRNVANRHAHKAEAYAAKNPVQQAGHGHH